MRSGKRRSMCQKKRASFWSQVKFSTIQGLYHEWALLEWSINVFFIKKYRVKKQMHVELLGVKEATSVQEHIETLFAKITTMLNVNLFLVKNELATVGFVLSTIRIIDQSRSSPEIPATSVLSNKKEI